MVDKLGYIIGRVIGSVFISLLVSDMVWFLLLFEGRLGGYVKFELVGYVKGVELGGRGVFVRVRG